MRLDDALPEHPKLLAVGPISGWLFIHGLCYANRNLTDGFVPTVVAHFAFDPDWAGHDTCEPVAASLVDAGLWERTEGGYMIHDYHDYQPTKAKVQGEREQARNRMRSSREVRPKFNDPVPVPKTTPEEQEQDQDQKQAPEGELSPSAAAAYRTLREVAKPGYAEVKFTVARFATLAAKYPTLDLADQAERLADWERYGKGETRATRDGIVAFRNWLDKAAAPSPNGHVAEVDYPWLPGCEPKRA